MQVPFAPYEMCSTPTQKHTHAYLHIYTKNIDNNIQALCVVFPVGLFMIQSSLFGHTVTSTPEVHTHDITATGALGLCQIPNPKALVRFISPSNSVVRSPKRTHKNASHDTTTCGCEATCRDTVYVEMII